MANEKMPKGFGICDSCSQAIGSKGYLVPVLNYVQCKDCFEDSSIQDTKNCNVLKDFRYKI